MFLGIDTSCYTTSVALLGEGGELLRDLRRPLLVKNGARGLRQAEMVFQHTRGLPGLIEEALAGGAVVQAVAVSDRPRPLQGSYMPAFAAGLSFARVLSAALGVSLYTISHQENHIEAGLWSAGGPRSDRFIALHCSGGTTDLLLAERARRFTLTRLGGGSDLNAGQYIDRLGVELGLSFPAGRALEELAGESQTALNIPVAVKGLDVSFSGPFTASRRLWRGGADKAALAAGAQLSIGKSLALLGKNACAESGCREMLLVGGVLSNKYIQGYIKKDLARYGIAVYCPERPFCLDGAVGCAALAWREAGE